MRPHNRLYTLALFVVLGGSANAIAGEAEDKAVQAIEKLGGNVLRNEDDPGRPVVVVDLSGTDVTDNDLKALTPLASLVSLDLHGTRVTGSGLEALAHLKKLERLYLSDSALDDRDSGITDRGLKGVGKLRNLTILHLGGTHISNAGVKNLAQLVNLRELSLMGTDITDDGLKHLAALTSLTRLGLEFTKIGDDGLKQLAPLKNLSELSLWKTCISDQGLKHLISHKKLTQLGLFDTAVTANGVKQLRKSLPKCEIFWDYLNQPDPALLLVLPIDRTLVR
jgi:hypothetical protein